jgi:hypothetical protein
LANTSSARRSLQIEYGCSAARRDDLEESTFTKTPCMQGLVREHISRAYRCSSKWSRPAGCYALFPLKPDGTTAENNSTAALWAQYPGDLNCCESRHRVAVGQRRFTSSAARLSAAVVPSQNHHAALWEMAIDLSAEASGHVDSSMVFDGLLREGKVFFSVSVSVFQFIYRHHVDRRLGLGVDCFTPIPIPINVEIATTYFDFIVASLFWFTPSGTLEHEERAAKQKAKKRPRTGKARSANWPLNVFPISGFTI